MQHLSFPPRGASHHLHDHKKLHFVKFDYVVLEERLLETHSYLIDLPVALLWEAASNKGFPDIPVLDQFLELF